MKKVVAIAFVSAIFISCNSSKKMTAMNNNTLTTEEKNEGWQLLFDGKTTNGWHKYGNTPVGSAWQVQDGNLVLDTTEKENWQTKGGGDILTEEEFENFHLKLEWMISEKGNSGIIFLLHESAQYKYPWETGLEMQVLDNDGHADGKIQKHRAGDLYDLIACSRETVKPVGEWNEAEVKCINGKLDLILNGETVVSTTLWDDNWKNILAASKFKSMPGFGTYKKGRIALQDHGDKVWYRNIRVREY